MNKFKIIMGATALAVAAVAIIACNKEKTAQQETTPTQQSAEFRDFTLAEMIEAMSWEDGKDFLENQIVKDYAYVCETVLNDCEDYKDTIIDSQFEISWYWPSSNGGCNTIYPGICKIIKDTVVTVNARGFIEDEKLVIIPTTNENGFTADGFLAVGRPIIVENDTIIIREGIYAAYYDEKTGGYVAVAVDVDVVK